MKKYKYPAIKLAVIYFVIGGLWILISDQIVSLSLPESKPLLNINIFKGLLFVVFTAAILYLIASNYLEKLHVENLKKKTTEKELSLSESKYRNLFENNPQPMWVYELDSLKFTDVNNIAIRKYGYSREEFLSMTIKDIRPEEDIEKLEQHITDIREKNITNGDSLIWQHKLKNNTIIYVKTLAHDISINNKQCRIILASDVTEIVKKENALRQSEIKYRNIFENIVDVYFETTIGGKIVELSPSIRILSHGQYKKEDLIGKQIASMYYDQTERTRYIRQLIKYKRVDDYEIKLVNKDGRIIYCSLTAKLINEDGVQRIVGSMRDISVRVNYEEDIIKAKEEAERANKLKTEFLAQMSHEIRTPLNIILNSNQLIKEELGEEKIKELEDLFLIQHSSGKRIIRTIDSILNMSDLQLGSYEPKFEKLDICSDVIEQMVKEYRVLAKEKNLQLRLEQNAEKPFIYADHYGTTQILSNLIDNAIKYTKEGEVVITVYDAGNTVNVDVIDSGMGISEDYIPHLFEAFTQENQGYSRTFEGNGLGLALVKKFCEINNASINVDSKLGEGSKFTVRFEKPTD